MNSIEKDKKIEELEAENFQLKEKEKRNQAFWGQLSQEIRTSLSGIVGISDQIKTSLNETDHLEEKIKEIDYNSENLFELANYIVDYSFLINDRMELKPVVFSIKEFLAEMAEELAPFVKRNKVHLFTNHYDIEELKINTDMERLKQIIHCYGEYAISHTPCDGNIFLTLKYENNEKGRVKIKFNFKTTGSNMYQAIAKDYEFLVRQMPRKNKFDGHGIELYVCNSLIDLMHGAVSYKSDNEFESQMSLFFEFEESFTEQVKHRRSYIFENERILIIEKDDAWCQRNREYLEDIGIAYDVAGDEEEALDRIGEAEDQKKPYNICLMKWKSADIQVEELVEEIRSLFGEEIVLIAVTEDDTVGVEKNRIEGLNYLVENSWIRSTIFDTIVKLKKGELVKQEELLLEQRNYDFENRRILLAEDVLMNAEIVVKMLNKVNVTVTEALNGLEAVSIFNRKPEGYFNCILMDINMPVMDGYTATREIRNSDKADAKTVPIYAMTANALSDDIQQALDAGMDGHIAKPVEPAKLYSLLEKIFDSMENDQFMKLKQTADELRQKNEDLLSKAEHDHLTGLLNRHGFERKIEAYRKQNEPVGLMLIDLDKFKGINDTYGHQVGDRVLQKLAITLRKHFRSTDDIIRFGGDEFAVILTNVLNEREFVIKHIEAVNEELQNPTDGLPAFSISTGVAFSKDGYSDVLYQNADKALYNIKEHGRCGCKIYAAEEEQESSEKKVQITPDKTKNIASMVNLYWDKGVLLHEAEDLLQKVLESNNVIGIVCGFYSEHYPIYSISMYMLQRLGYTTEEFMESCGDNFEKLIFKFDTLVLHEAEEKGKIIDSKIRLVHKDGEIIWFHVALANDTTKDGRKMWFASFREIDSTLLYELCDMDYEVIGVIDCSDEKIFIKKGIENLKEYPMVEEMKYDYDTMLKFSIEKNIVESERDNVYRKSCMEYVIRKLELQPNYKFTARREREDGEGMFVEYKFRYLNFNHDGIVCTQKLL